MTTHGPIYLLVKKEIEIEKIGLKHIGATGILNILPEIQRIEQSKLHAHSETMRECGEELEKYRMIPVSERMPDIETEVVVWEGDRLEVATLNWETPSPEETFQAFQYWWTTSEKEIEPTHWMPLPPTE